VRDFGGIETEVVADDAAGVVVILLRNSIVEEELGLAFGAVNLDGNSDGRAQQNSILALPGDEQVALLQSESLTKPGGNDKCSALADAGGFRF
jgi:hypothetical protein